MQILKHSIHIGNAFKECTMIGQNSTQPMKQMVSFLPMNQQKQYHITRLHYFDLNRINQGSRLSQTQFAHNFLGYLAIIGKEQLYELRLW